MPNPTQTEKPARTTRRTVSEILRSLDACDEAIAWARPYGTDGATAWAECDNPEWMLWLLGKLSGEPGSPERRKLVGCCADIAALVLPIFEVKFPGDSRVRDCIEVCRKYATGKATLVEVTAAAAATFMAAARAAMAAARAAFAAVDAAGNAVATSRAAAGAAWAAADSARAAAGAAWAAVVAWAAVDAAGAAMRKEICDLIRHQYPTPPIVQGD